MTDKCTSSSVEHRKDLTLNGKPHAGFISHICQYEKNHEPPCVCECGLYAWKRHSET